MYHEISFVKYCISKLRIVVVTNCPLNRPKSEYKNPPGNDHISHPRKKKIINSKVAAGRGYVIVPRRVYFNYCGFWGHICSVGWATACFLKPFQVVQLPALHIAAGLGGDWWKGGWQGLKWWVFSHFLWSGCTTTTPTPTPTTTTTTTTTTTIDYRLQTT